MNLRKDHYRWFCSANDRAAVVDRRRPFLPIPPISQGERRGTSTVDPTLSVHYVSAGRAGAAWLPLAGGATGSGGSASFGFFLFDRRESCTLIELVESLRLGDGKSETTPNGGPLGSRFDEERSKLRYLV